MVSKTINSAVACVFITVCVCDGWGLVHHLSPVVAGSGKKEWAASGMLIKIPLKLSQRYS